MIFLSGIQIASENQIENVKSQDTFYHLNTKNFLVSSSDPRSAQVNN